MSNSQKKMDNIIDPDMNTISLDKAIARTTAWRDWIQGVNSSPSLPHSFYIEKEDIINLYNMYNEHPDVVGGYRVYMAKTEEPQSPFKLIFIATNTAKGDILNKIPENDPTAPPIDPGQPSRIYDFSVPCPNTCHDVSSPLVTGILPQPHP